MADETEIRIKDLSRTATEADLVAGNFFVMDSSDSPKVPAELLAKKSDVSVIAADSIVVEQGTYNLMSGVSQNSSYRLRSVNLIPGFGKLIAPGELKVTAVLYYDQDGIFHSKEEFYPYKKEISFGLEGYFARFIFGISDSMVVDKNDFCNTFGLDSLNDRIIEIQKNELYELSSYEYDRAPRRTDQSYDSPVPMTLASQSGYVSYVVNVSIGDVIQITGLGGDNYRLWAFVSNADKMLMKSAADSSESGRVFVSKYNGKFVVNYKISSPYSLRFYKNRNQLITESAAAVALLSTNFEKISKKEISTGTRFIFSSKNTFKMTVSASVNQAVEHTNVNLLPPVYSPTSKTTYGVTFTKQDDYSVTAVGNASGNAHFEIVGSGSGNRLPLPAGSYVLRGAPGVTGCRCAIGITGVGEKYDTGSGIAFTVESDTTYYMDCTVLSGNNVNVIFKPMLMRTDAMVSDFVTPKKETITLSGGDDVVVMYDGINILSSSSSFTSKQDVVRIEGVSVNLKDFAVGDGVTDDTDAINLALVAAAGKTLEVPAGTYLFSATLNVKSGTKIIGSGESSKFKLADAFSLSGVSWRTGNAAYRRPFMLLEENADGCVISNFAIEGQTSAYKDENEDGILVRGKNHLIENVVVRKINYFYEGFLTRSCLTPGYAINIFNAANVTVRNVHCYECGYQDIGVENSSRVSILDSLFGDGCQTKIQVHRNSSDVTIRGNKTYNVDRVKPSLTLDAPTDKPMENIFIENNVIASSFTCVGGGENKLFVVGNLFATGVEFQHDVAYQTGVVFCSNRVKNRVQIRADEVVMVGNFIGNDGNAANPVVIYGNTVKCESNAYGHENSGPSIIGHE